MSFQREIKFQYEGREREATVQLDEDSFDLTFDVVLDDGYQAVIFVPFDKQEWYEYKKGPNELAAAIGKELDKLIAAKESSFIIRVQQANVSYTINVVPLQSHPFMEYQIWIMDKFQFSVMQVQEENGALKWRHYYNNSGTIIDQEFVDKIGEAIEGHDD